MSTRQLGAHHPFVSAEAATRFREDYDRYEAQSPFAWDARCIDTSVGSVFVRSVGPLDAPHMVLLPGAGGNSLMWPVELIGMLSQRYRLHAIDPIDDIGRSLCSIAVVTPSDHMRVLDELLGALSPAAKVVLVGGSRGGWMTAAYSLHSPERLASAIWLSPALVSAGWSTGTIHFFLLAMPMMRGATTKNVDAMLRWILPRFSAQQPAAFTRMVEHTAVCYQCFDTSVVGRGRGPRRFSDQELASIMVPTLYLAGADERMSTSSHAALARLQRVAPRIEGEVFDGAGHDLTWVRSEDVSRRMLKFLARIGGAA